MMPLHMKIGLSKQWLVGLSDGTAFRKDYTIIKAQFWTQLQVSSANFLFSMCAFYSRLWLMKSFSWMLMLVLFSLGSC